MDKNMKDEIIVALIYVSQFATVFIITLGVTIKINSHIGLIVMSIGLLCIVIGNLIYRKLSNKQQSKPEVEHE